MHLFIVRTDGPNKLRLTRHRVADSSAVLAGEGIPAQGTVTAMTMTRTTRFPQTEKAGIRLLARYGS